MLDEERRTPASSSACPDVPTSDDYIYHSIEIQIDDDVEGHPPHGRGLRHRGADGQRLTADRASGITSRSSSGAAVSRSSSTASRSWTGTPEPGGKVKDFAPEGYIGLQNHDSHSPPYFRNIYVKELK